MACNQGKAQISLLRLVRSLAPSKVLFACVEALYPSQQFSVMSGHFPVFLGYISIKQRIYFKVSCSRTQHNASDESLTSDFTLQANALPLYNEIFSASILLLIQEGLLSVARSTG